MYEVINRKISYRVGDDGSVRCARRVTVRALRDGLGSLVERVPLVGDGAEAATVRVGFGRPLRAGEVGSVEVEWPVAGGVAGLPPFLAEHVAEPLLALEFEVRVPVAMLADRHAVVLVQCGAAAVGACRARPVVFDVDGAVRWHVDRPALGHYHVLRWSWAATAVPDAVPGYAEGDTRVLPAKEGAGG